MFADLYKTHKTTKNQLSNFGLNEEIMYLVGTLLTSYSIHYTLFPKFVLL